MSLLAGAAQSEDPYRWNILGLTDGGQAATAALFQGLPSIGPALTVAYALSLGKSGSCWAASSSG